MPAGTVYCVPARAIHDRDGDRRVDRRRAREDRERFVALTDAPVGAFGLVTLALRLTVCAARSLKISLAGAAVFVVVAGLMVIVWLASIEPK